MNESETIQDAILGLSSKKDNLVTEASIRAHHERQQSRQSQGDGKTQYLVEEFTSSVRVLSGIFKQSKLDEMVLMLSRPYRLLGLTLMIGVLRGLGFGIGFFLVVGVLAMMLGGQAALVDAMTRFVMALLG